MILFALHACNYEYGQVWLVLLSSEAAVPVALG